MITYISWGPIRNSSANSQFNMLFLSITFEQRTTTNIIHISRYQLSTNHSIKPSKYLILRPMWDCNHIKAPHIDQTYTNRMKSQNKHYPFFLWYLIHFIRLFWFFPEPLVIGIMFCEPKLNYSGMSSFGFLA